MNHIQESFPGLRESEFRVTSPVDPGYNCIAWAAGDVLHFWWPDPFDEYYWPIDAPRVPTLAAFIQAYAAVGYERCDSDQPEEHYERVAVFVNATGSPTHAARQLRSGRWTSKLGQHVDIEHDLRDLEGEKYGKVAVFLKRANRTSSSR